MDSRALMEIFPPRVVHGFCYAMARLNLGGRFLFGNVVITNVPGSRAALNIAGAPLVTVIPMAPMPGAGLALTVTVSSTARYLLMGFHGEGAAIWNKALFVEGAPQAAMRYAARYAALAHRQRNGHNSHMIRTSVSGLKNGLSEYLRKVRAGQSVVIYDRNVPIARIERIESGGSDDERVTRLRAEGITRPPVKRIGPARLAAGLAVIPATARVLAALLEERAEER